MVQQLHLNGHLMSLSRRGLLYLQFEMCHPNQNSLLLRLQHISLRDRPNRIDGLSLKSVEAILANNHNKLSNHYPKMIATLQWWLLRNKSENNLRNRQENLIIN